MSSEVIRMRKQVKLSGKVLKWRQQLIVRWWDMKRKKRDDWCDDECQIKGEEINKAQIKMLKGRTRMNTEDYKNKWREAKKMCRPQKEKVRDLKVLEGMEEAN
jgi:hypothetical protein